MAKVLATGRVGSHVWHNGITVRVGDKLSKELADELVKAGWAVKDVPDKEAAEPAPQVQNRFVPAAHVADLEK